MGTAKYFIDKNFFDIIGEKQAYYLGLLYADGCHTRSNRKYTIRLALHNKDKEILDKFNTDLQHEKPLRKNRDMLELEISNKYMSERFLELGLIPRKTFDLIFPKWLDNSLYNHFIRGYFDGDGSIGFYKTNNPKCSEDYRSARFSLVSTEDFCNSIKDIFGKLFSINCKLTIRHKDRINTTRQIQIGGNIQVKTVLDYLYFNSTIHMERKYKLYRDFYYGN